MPEQRRRTLIKGIFVFLTMFIIASSIHSLAGQPILLTTLAASTFIIFMRRRSETAAFKNLLGSYSLSGFSGLCIAVIMQSTIQSYFSAPTALALLAGLSVTLASVMMYSFHLDHPPAAGVALAFAFATNPAQLVEVILVAISVIIALIVLKGSLHLIEKVLLRTEHKIANWLRDHLFD